MSKFLKFQIVALLLLACSTSFGQAPQGRQSSSSSDEQALKKLNDELFEATSRRDLPTLERIMSETLTATDDEGRLSTRAQVFERIRALPDDLEQAFTPDEVQVRIYDNAAVVTARVTEVTEIAKQRREQQYRVTQTFVREGQASRWRLVATQSARLSGDPEAIIVNPKIYDAYVGEYQINPTLKFTITKEDNRLVVHVPGQAPMIFLPKAKDKFFVRGTTAEYVFIRDAKGRVTHFVSRDSAQETNGPEVRAQKIK